MSSSTNSTRDSQPKPSADETLNQKLDDSQVVNTDHQLPQPPEAVRYRILRPHARGGLGEVFIAEDTELGRNVALKEIQPRFARDPLSRSRFVLEAEITGGLEHPGIVPVYGLGAYSDGRPFYAMRFIRGESLKEAIGRFHGAIGSKQGKDDSRRFDSLAFRELLRRFIDVCNAVAYAHSRGVLHRDLKPGNVMLGEFGETLVVDWGLAKAMTSSEPERPQADADSDSTLKPRSAGVSSATIAGTTLGTPAYMPPEQAEGRLDDLGPASDVYSLGATLYVLLAGKKPFEGPVDEVLDKVIQGEFVPPRSVNAAVPRALEAVCIKAMAQKPRDRYASALDLASDVNCWLADEPASAWREPAGVKARRWMRKHARLTTGIAAALVVGVIGMSGIAWQREQARAAVDAEKSQTAVERDTARTERDRADEEKLIAQSVRDFLQKKLLIQSNLRAQADALLEAGRSSAETERDPRISVLLGRAAAELTPDKIEAQFPRQPLVQAEILLTIGDAYIGIGNIPAAIAHMERARELRLAHLGADHPKTLGTVDHLGSAYLDAGRLPDAIRLFEQVRDAEAARYGAGHLATLPTLNNLAVAYQSTGRLSEATRILEQVRDTAAASYGADHPDTLITRYNLARAYGAGGKLIEAIALFEQVRDVQVAKLGADHPNTLATLNHLAGHYSDAGKLDEAIRIYEQARDVCAAKFAADHPQALATNHNLAAAYLESGRVAEATPLFEKVRDAQVPKLGADHPDTLSNLNDLARAYFLGGKVPEAIRLFEQVRDAQTAKLGADHPSTLTTLGNLAAVHQATGKLAEAIRLHEQVRDAQIAKLGPDHPGTLATIGNLAAAYYSSGNVAEAAALFDRAATGFEKLSFQNQYAGMIVTNAAACQEKLEQFEKAERWRRKWLAVVKERSGEGSPAYAAELADLGKNLTQQKKYVEAETVLSECRAIRDKLEPGEWTTFLTQSMLGAALSGQRKYAAAEPLLVQGYEGMKKTQDKIPNEIRTKRLFETVNSLVKLYDEWGKPAEAAKWKKELESLKKPG